MQWMKTGHSEMREATSECLSAAAHGMPREGGGMLVQKLQHDALARHGNMRAARRE
jgi:hypothetical protein